MDKKRQEGYISGLVCLLIFALFAYFAIMSISNTPAAVIMGIFAASFGGLGFGSLAKPDTFGAIVSQFLNNIGKSSEERSSDSHNTQIQKKSNGSVQVMASDGTEVNINLPKKPSTKERELSRMAKTFCCPNGHECIVHPPDDNHPLASLEEDYAKQNASGTVIPRQYTCKERNCGSQFTLYWYQQKRFFERV